MNTPAHIALGLAVLGRRARRRDWWVIVVGAVLPDLFILIQFYARGLNPSGATEALALLVKFFNSAPLYLGVLAAGFAVRLRWLVLLAAAALAHIAFDLPFHSQDARPHFFPLTEWQFVSPVSFWDARHHGRLVGLLEGALFSFCFVVIWRRLNAPWERVAAAAFAAAYLAAFVHFAGHAFADRYWAVW